MMRQILIMSALCLVMAAHAQQKMRFSIMVNPNLSWLSSDVRTVKPNRSLLGFDAGIVADAFFSENYAFSTGLSIGTIGGTLQYIDPTSFELNKSTITLPAGTSVKYNIQYLTVPLGLKMKSIEIGYITYYGQMGFNTHFNILAKGTSSDAVPLLDKDNISRAVSFFNLGYFIGGGIEYSIGGHNALIFGLLYNHGFLDLTKLESDKILYNSVSLRLGFLF